MSYPWGGRREDEPTSRYLARVLAEYVGMDGMAQAALANHYDDYFCPPDVDDGMNIHRLIADMHTDARGADAAKLTRVRVVEEAAKAGEFDGTSEEARAWSQSDEGQATFQALIEGA